MTTPEMTDPVLIEGRDSTRPGLFLMTNSFETGGSARQFVTLAQSLSHSNFRLQVGCLAKHGGFLNGFEDAVEFPVSGNLYGARSLRTRLRLASFLRRSRTAVAHAFDFYTNLVLIPAARLARVPVVIGSQRQLGDLLTPAKFRAQLAAFRWCDRVICNSRAAADQLIDRGMANDRVVVIGNGLPHSAFQRAKPVLDRSPNVLRVGMIARMNSRSKNHSEFLLAAARVVQGFPGVEFVLVGDGPLRGALEQQALDLNIRDRVHFLGELRETSDVLASLDISVLPSTSESLSNTVLESMAAGVPVVATQVGGNAELLADRRGILVSPGDVHALASGIELLLGNPEMRVELGCKGRKFAESNFTIAAMRQRHEELYSELLEAKGWPHKRQHRSSSKEVSARRLRVAIIAPSSRYVGGQSVQAEQLLQNWRNDADVEAFPIPIDPALPRGFKWVESVPFLRTLVRQPFYLAALWRGLSGADIAHIFSASYWSFLIAPAPAWILAKMRGTKTMIHYHSGEARDHLQRFRSARPVLARADRLVVPSKYLVDVFRDFGLTADVVPNIVDVSRLTFRERSPLRPRLVCTRGFHLYYRVDVVVRAFAEIQREFPLARLDLVGQGPSEGEIRELVSQLKIDGVNFAGVASRQAIAHFYDAADIFINASALDNMPVSILEAFASGTPVVSTAPEGIRYLVEHEHTGLLCEPGDASALAQNVIRLLRDSSLAARIASNAYEESKHYRWIAVRPQWLDIYRSLVRHSKRESCEMLEFVGSEKRIGQER